MAYKLTYLSILILFASIVSSCSTDESRVGELVQGSRMTFEVAGDTRASVTSTSDINAEGSRFVIFGDIKFPENSDRNQMVLFNKAEIAYRNGVWSYEGIQYWINDGEHSFVAIHPVTVTEPDNFDYSNSQVSFTYAIPSTNDGKVSKGNINDILAATHRRLYHSDDPASPVSFKFGHLLSLINLSAAFDDNIMDEKAYIEFHTLELSGFNTKATFSLFPSSLLSNRQTDDRDITVTAQSGAGNMTVEFGTPVKIMNDRAYVKLFADNDALVMLPQTFSADSEAKLTLTYTINDDPTRKKVTMPLNSIVWAIGKSYNYRLTLNRTGLVVANTAITDWDKLDAGNFDAR